MSRADLILKLAVGKDRRTVAPVETGGHFKYFFGTFSSNFKKVLVNNLIYSAIFALPLLFSIFVLPILVTNYVYSGKGFIGNFGIGFPNVADSFVEAVSYNQYINRILVFPCILASTFIAFVGLSGVFHCSRGYMWGEKVNVKSFFRGIKKLWKPFMLVGAVFTVVLAGFLYGMDYHSTLVKTGSATVGSYFVAVIVGLAGGLSLAYLIVLLPSIACYDFKMKDHLKNALLLILIMPIPSLFVTGFTVALFCICLATSYLALMFAFLLIAFGFFFFAMMWTTYGQYLFDLFIVTQVDDKGNRIEVAIKKKNGQDANEYVGAKKSAKNAEKEANNPNYNSNGGKKKKNQNTYSSSYKRKPNNQYKKK